MHHSFSLKVTPCWTFDGKRSTTARWCWLSQPLQFCLCEFFPRVIFDLYFKWELKHKHLRRNLIITKISPQRKIKFETNKQEVMAIRSCWKSDRYILERNGETGDIATSKMEIAEPAAVVWGTRWRHNTKFVRWPCNLSKWLTFNTRRLDYSHRRHMLLDQPGSGAEQHYHTHIPSPLAYVLYLPHP